MGFALLAIVGMLLCVALWRKDYPRSIVFAVVIAGLVLMIAIPSRDGVDGIVAFAIWTIASYMLRNFSWASVLFLSSEFCYNLELKGLYLWQIQAVSNVLGVVGLAAIWYGRPKWDHKFSFGRGVGSPVGCDVGFGIVRNSEGKTK
jgi:hypothetical protein